MSSCCQWHSLAAVSVAYNEGKLLEKMGGGGGGGGERWRRKEDARGFMCNRSL